MIETIGIIFMALGWFFLLDSMRLTTHDDDRSDDALYVGVAFYFASFVL